MTTTSRAAGSDARASASRITSRSERGVTATFTTAALVAPMAPRVATRSSGTPLTSDIDSTTRPPNSARASSRSDDRHSTSTQRAPAATAWRSTASRAASASPLRPPSDVGRHAAMTGRVSPSSARATSRSATPSKRTSRMSAAPPARRPAHRSAVLRPAMLATIWTGLGIRLILKRKRASPAGGLKRLVSSVRVAGLASVHGAPSAVRRKPPPIRRVRDVGAGHGDGEG